jgi:hypothetical protein
MVHEKKLSGDPDYDDKVPLVAQVGYERTAPDGTKYLETPAQGLTTLEGEHFNLAAHSGGDARVAGDNRPKPGEVATEASTAQAASPVDFPDAEEPVYPDPQPITLPEGSPATTFGDATPVDEPVKAPAKRTTK